MHSASKVAEFIFGRQAQVALKSRDLHGKEVRCPTFHLSSNVGDTLNALRAFRTQFFKTNT